jgi:predicted ATPase
MITEVTVRGFKRFANERFPFAQLTVLTGLNGSGKTSLIQAILVMRVASRTTGTSMPLNGPFDLELGVAEDVRNWRATGIEVLAKSTSLGDLDWHFTIPSNDALYLDIAVRPKVVPAAFSAHPRAFTYLSAERLGPRTASAMSPLPEDEIEVGTRGENCAHLLSTLGNKILAQSARTHPLYAASTPRLLKYEVEQWR